MNRFAFFVVLTTPIFFASCLGSDPMAATGVENTAGTCTDGLDNDGDGDFDCYDAECYALDKKLRLKGDTLCHYEDYTPIFVPSSSSKNTSSSGTSNNASSGASSSSANSSSSAVALGFPYSYAAFPEDSTQILTLYRKAGTNEILFAGRIRQHGLYGTVDTTGKVVSAPEVISSTAVPSQYTSIADWIPSTRSFWGIDTNASGEYLVYGYSGYNQGIMATSWRRSGDNSYTSFWVSEMAQSNYAFLGIASGKSQCIAVNQVDTGFVQIDADMTDASINLNFPIKIADGAIAKGRINGETCEVIANRTTSSPDSSQIWYGRVLKTNDLDVKALLDVGSATAKGYDLVSVGNMTYVAATVNGFPRMLVLNSSGVVTINGASQALGSGTPKSIRTIKVGSSTRLLMVGESGGQGALWLLDTDGNKVSQSLIPQASAFSDVIQLGNGDLIVSGWKSNVPNGAGTTAVLLKISTSLSLVTK